jgi:hypothetical protein
VRDGKCLLRGMCWEARKSDGNAEGWAVWHGRKREARLRGPRKSQHQTMRLAVTSTAHAESMSRGTEGMVIQD